MADRFLSTLYFDDFTIIYKKLTRLLFVIHYGIDEKVTNVEQLAIFYLLGKLNPFRSIVISDSYWFMQPILQVQYFLQILNWRKKKLYSAKIYCEHFFLRIKIIEINFFQIPFLDHLFNIATQHLAVSSVD